MYQEHKMRMAWVQPSQVANIKTIYSGMPRHQFQVALKCTFINDANKETKY